MNKNIDFSHHNNSEILQDNKDFVYYRPEVLGTGSMGFCVLS